jgi:hypothetical protein
MPKFSLREILPAPQQPAPLEQTPLFSSSFFTLDLARARAILDRKLAALEAAESEPAKPLSQSINAACAVLGDNTDSQEDVGVPCAALVCAPSLQGNTPPTKAALAAGIGAAFSVFLEVADGDNN